MVKCRNSAPSAPSIEGAASRRPRMEQTESPSRAFARRTSAPFSRRPKRSSPNRDFGGATMAAIAARAGVPKPNVHYYFPTKERLYRAVIERVLTAWLAAASSFDTSDDPARGADLAISAPRWTSRAPCRSARRSGRARSCAARRHPGFSRHDADAMGALARARIVRRWIADGKLKPIEPKVPVLHDLGDDPAIRQRRARDRDARARPARDAAFERAKRQVVETILGGVVAR